MAVTSRRTTSIVGVVAALAVLVGVVLVVGGEAPGPARSQPTSRPSTTATGLAAVAGADPAVQRVRAVVQRVLDLRVRDASAPRLSASALTRLRRSVAPPLRAAQVQLARNLTAVPLAAYSLEATDPPSLRAVRQGRVTQTVTLRYRLAGDQVTSEGSVATTFERRAGRWVLTRWQPQSPQVWDLGVVHAAVRGPVVVVGDVSAARIEAVASAAEQALAGVRATWPYAWSHRVTLVVPSDAHDMATLVDMPRAQIVGLGALTNTETPDYRGRAAVRVTVNPMYFWQQSALGQQIVLRHEFTHVAQWGLGPRHNAQVPLWIKEGIADYVGYLHSGVPVAVVASDLLDRVRAGHLPALPSDDDFSFTRSAQQRGLAYRAGWTFCVYLADRYGAAAPFRFYRTLALAHGSEGARVTSALSGVTGSPQADVVRDWHTWLLDRS